MRSMRLIGIEIKIPRVEAIEITYLRAMIGIFLNELVRGQQHMAQLMKHLIGLRTNGNINGNGNTNVNGVGNVNGHHGDHAETSNAHMHGNVPVESGVPIMIRVTPRPLLPIFLDGKITTN